MNEPRDQRSGREITLSEGSAPEPSKAERIHRLRKRLRAAHDALDVRNVVLGVLDLLGDEL